MQAHVLLNIYFMMLSLKYLIILNNHVILDKHRERLTIFNKVLFSLFHHNCSVRNFFIKYLKNINTIDDI